LEDGGLLERRIGAGDRRISRIHVTSRGYTIVDRMSWSGNGSIR
jgi:hypothetical protein